MSRGELEKREAQERPGCLTGVVQLVMQALLRLFGIGGQQMRRTLEPLDTYYQEFVDAWVSENLARWLNQTRAEFQAALARSAGGSGSSARLRDVAV